MLGDQDFFWKKKFQPVQVSTNGICNVKVDHIKIVFHVFFFQEPSQGQKNFPFVQSPGFEPGSQNDSRKSGIMFEFGNGISKSFIKMENVLSEMWFKTFDVPKYPKCIQWIIRFGIPRCDMKYAQFQRWGMQLAKPKSITFK